MMAFNYQLLLIYILSFRFLKIFFSIFNFVNGPFNNKESSAAPYIHALQDMMLQLI